MRSSSGLLINFTNEFREKKADSTTVNAATPDAFNSSTNSLLSSSKGERPCSETFTARCESAQTPFNDPHFLNSRAEQCAAYHQHNREDSWIQAAEDYTYRMYLDAKAKRAQRRKTDERALKALREEIKDLEEKTSVEIKQLAEFNSDINDKKQHALDLQLRVIDGQYVELVLEAQEKKDHLTKEQRQLLLELMNKKINQLKCLLLDVSNRNYKDKIEQLILKFDQWSKSSLFGVSTPGLCPLPEASLAEKNYFDSYLFTGKRSKIKPWANGFIVFNVFRLAFVRGLQEINSCSKLLPPGMKAALPYIGWTVGLIGCGIYGFRLSRNLYCGSRNLYKTGSADYFWRHKHELFNDVCWVTAGILCFGMSTHLYLQAATLVLGPGGILLTAALYGLDVINASWSYYSSIKQIDTTTNTLQEELIEYRKKRHELYCAIVDDLSLGAVLKNIAKGLGKTNLEVVSEWINDKEVMAVLFDRIATNNLTLTEEQKELIFSYCYFRHQVIYKKSRLDRLPARKEFLHVQGKVRVAAAVGYLATIAVIAVALTVFSGPVVPLLVASSVMLIVCAVEFYMKRVYLPRKEIELAYNPADLLHDKLLGHVTYQLKRLKDNKRSGTTFDRRRAAEKIREYENAREELAVWQIEEKRPYDKLAGLIEQVIKASMKNRKTTGEPSSAKHLRQLLAPFSKVEWKSEWKGVSNVDVNTCTRSCIEAMKPLQLSWKKRSLQLNGSLFSYGPDEVKTVNHVHSSEILTARFHPTAMAH
ncbi:MAG: hypothetical protein P1U34_05115 [Coxiellaceae bacterium]|nr:hypothetical protein [Coxiellaceae bacterium]